MALFEGFPKSCIPYLKKLAKNNNRPWFNEHKQRYEDDVRSPALAFVEVMGPQLKKHLSPHFLAQPKKVGGSLMRVYRDTRFANDKTPFKTNVGIQFRHELGKDVHAADSTLLHAFQFCCSLCPTGKSLGQRDRRCPVCGLVSIRRF